MKKMMLLTTMLLAFCAQSAFAEEAETETETKTKAMYTIDEAEKIADKIDGISVENDEIVFEVSGESGDEALTEEDAANEIRIQLYKEPSIVYAKTAVYARELPETSSEIVRILDLAEEAYAYAGNEDWIVVETEDGLGFVSAKYLTDSSDEAESCVEQENAARAAAEAAAAAATAAQAAAEAEASAGSSSGSSGKSVVSKEKVANCNDPSHGTIYITYSDGSTGVQNY